MFAVIRTGGRQYRAEVGAIIDVERLPNPEGESFEIDEVLMIADGDSSKVGAPLVEGAKVKVTVTRQYRDRKIVVWKYKPKNRYRRKKGHRQYYTSLRIDDIIGG